MTSIAQVTETTVTVVVPLAIRRRNGRPKIVLPEHCCDQVTPGHDQAGTTVLRAIARAWGWRRRLEAGELNTLQDIAHAEKVTVPFVSRFIRLAYLSPRVVERIVAEQEGIAVSLDHLSVTAWEPWAMQSAVIFDAPES
jgi:hypothetical protein